MVKLIRWATTDPSEQADGLPSVRDLLAKGWRASGPHPTRPTMWLMSVDADTCDEFSVSTAIRER